MAGATGLEPATSGVTGRRSNQLSYAPATLKGGRISYAPDLGVSSRAMPAASLPGRLPGAMDDSRNAQERVVGDEGFEPPTPSV
jgi:hypothetical protein